MYIIQVLLCHKVQILVSYLHHNIAGDESLLAPRIHDKNERKWGAGRVGNPDNWPCQLQPPRNVL